MTKYLDMDIVEINKLLKEKKIKPVDLVNESYERYLENKHINAFITTTYEEAIKKAISLEDKEVDNILFGIPIVVKDNISTKDIKTTAASKMLENYIPVYDATVIDIINKYNMIIVGKANMDEFAMGSTNQTSYFGPVLNPIDNNLVPGGSSGGSAALVASRVVSFALGSDTGGSIRQPSSFCGTVGMKPTYGTVSRYGLIAFASSLDQIGPITNNVYNNALLLNILKEYDYKDYTKEEINIDYTRLIGEDVKGKKIAIPSYYISDLIDKEIKEKLDSVISTLKESGLTVDIVDIDTLKYSVLLYEIIAMSEASSNLARYDGIRYGHGSCDASSLDDYYKINRSIAFGSEVKRRIMIGSYLLSGKNKDIYYTKALMLRNKMKDDFNNIFKKYDFIIGPTTTTPAYELGSKNNDELKSFYDDILTIPANLTGLPALSLPIGKTKNNLPIGMQIISKSFNEDKIYMLASYIEKKVGVL